MRKAAVILWVVALMLSATLPGWTYPALGDALGAIKNEDIQKLDDMLHAPVDQRLDPNILVKFGSRGEYEETLLMYAAHNNRIQSVRLLLRDKADPNKATSDGWTPLLIAVRASGNRNTVAICQLLLDAGADPNAEHEGANALWIAFDYLQNPSIRDEVIRMLLVRHADPNRPDGSNKLLLSKYIENRDAAIADARDCKADLIYYADPSLPGRCLKIYQANSMIAILRQYGAKESLELPPFQLAGSTLQRPAQSVSPKP